MGKYGRWREEADAGVIVSGRLLGPLGACGPPSELPVQGGGAQRLLLRPCLEQELSRLAGPEGAPGRGMLGWK